MVVPQFDITGLCCSVSVSFAEQRLLVSLCVHTCVAEV